MKARAAIFEWFWRNELWLFFFATGYAVQFIFIIVLSKDIFDFFMKSIVLAIGLGLLAQFARYKGSLRNRPEDEVAIVQNELMMKAESIPFESIRAVYSTDYLDFPTSLRLILHDRRRVRARCSRTNALHIIEAVQATGIPVKTTVVTNQMVRRRWLVLLLLSICLCVVALGVRQILRH